MTILGLGAACVDLSIPVTEEFLSHVHGGKGGALPISLSDLEQLIDQSKQAPLITCGGSCANTLKGLAHLGHACQLLSCVGQDSFGIFFQQTMQQLKISTLIRQSSLPTTRVLCLITPDGQRTMRFYTGASQDISEDQIETIDFSQLRHVHIDAYSFQHAKLVKHLIQKADDHHLTISMDLSSYEIVQKYHSLIHEILPFMTLVFANRNEIYALTHLSPQEGCRQLQTICPIAVILMDKEGCLVGAKGEIFSVSPFPTQVVDTTGAGDFFNSGFLHRFLHQDTLVNCARFGNRLGSLIVAVHGTDLSDREWEIYRNFI